MWVQGLVTTKPHKATRDITQKHVPCSIKSGRREKVFLSEEFLERVSLFFWNAILTYRPSNARISSCGSRESKKTAMVEGFP